MVARKYMGKMQRNKGYIGEHELVGILRDAGVSADRIAQLETDKIRKGDVLVADVWKGSVKYGNHVPQFIYDAKENGEEMLFLRKIARKSRGYKWLVCMDLDFFLEKFL